MVAAGARPWFDSGDMNVITQVFAVVAGLFHVYVFVLESVLFPRRPQVQRTFLGHDHPDPDVLPWAFNQGFYNLFLAAGAIGGVIACHAGQPTAGRAVTLFACACMAGAGVVLVASQRRLWRAAVAQAVPPLIALVAALF
jgi:putative membrane protein